MEATSLRIERVFKPHFRGPKPAKRRKIGTIRGELRMERSLAVVDHTAYRPGPITSMGADQCKFIPGENHICCGKRVRDDKTSYCAEHHALCHTVKADPHLANIEKKVSA